jgi:intracellular septation protein A
MYCCRVVDCIFNCHTGPEQATFLRLTPEQAYKIIEIELWLMYDTLHSKAAVIRTWYGRVFRCLTLLFNVLDKGQYNRIDVCITNMLFGGALCLEAYAIGMMIISYWTYAALQDCNCQSLSNLVFKSIKYFRP